MLIAFSIPLSVAIPNLLAAIVLVIWIIIGNFKSDWNKLKSNKVILSVLVFFTLHIIGLLWTNSLEFGFLALKKDLKLLLIPLFMLFTKKEHIQYYIYAFLLAISLAELSSYAVYFEIIAPFMHATLELPTPFLGHIIYNPLLAIAVYILLLYLLLSKNILTKQKILYSIFLFTMSVNMFITGGKAGQVLYFAIILIVLFQYFNTQKLKAFILSTIIIPTIFTLAYFNSSIFHERFNDLYKTIIAMESTNESSSTSQRLNYLLNSIVIVERNPIIGVGTGGFRLAYDKINKEKSPNFMTTINPHNMYIFELAELGILGFISLLSIFYNQIVIALKIEDKTFRLLAITFPILFLIIMFTERYLLISNTAYLFALFSAFLYKDYPIAEE